MNYACACEPSGQHSNDECTITLTIVFVSHNNNISTNEYKNCLAKTTLENT